MSSDPSPLQLKIFDAYVRCGSHKQTAHELGITHSSVRNNLSQLYIKLGVSGALETLNALGWVVSPIKEGYMPCGWLAYCTRPQDHRGQHGGFRPFVRRIERDEGND